MNRNAVVVSFSALILAVAHAGAAAQRAPVNRSRGGADATTGPSRLQARWANGGSHAGLFVGGGATLHDLARGQRPVGTAAFVLAVAERALDGRLMTYIWTPRIERVFRDTSAHSSGAATAAVVSLFQTADARFSSISQGFEDVSPAALPTPAPTRGKQSARGPGSTLSGLPALSVDPTSQVFQAGWSDAGRRYGALAKGNWSVDGTGRLVVDRSDGWLVGFEQDTASGVVTLLQAIRRASGVETGYWVDAESRQVDPAANALAARVVRWIASARADSMMLQ